MLNKNLLAFAFAGAIWAWSNSNAQELSAFTAEQCKDISIADVSEPTGPAFAAWFCGSAGATRTVNQQVAAGNAGCIKFLGSYGAFHQHELLRVAKLDAKAGDFLEAVGKIAACQCHNPPIERRIRDRSQELICWLRAQ